MQKEINIDDVNKICVRREYAKYLPVNLSAKCFTPNELAVYIYSKHYSIRSLFHSYYISNQHLEEYISLLIEKVIRNNINYVLNDDKKAFSFVISSMRNIIIDQKRLCYNRYILRQNYSEDETEFMLRPFSHSQNEELKFSKARRDALKKQIKIILNQINIPEQKAMVILHYKFDCQYDYIAEFLNVTIGAVKSSLFRFRERLNEKINYKKICLEYF